MFTRRRAIGAEVAEDGVDFRVWAPAHAAAGVVIDGRDHPLRAEGRGYFSGIVAEARAGTRYRIRMDDEKDAWPDPASRFQPEGPHGDSEVVDSSTFVWQYQSPRVEPQGRVIYELHVGTFTPSGTWRGAIETLPLLADVGIDVIEMMPVHEFPGAFGWGYDGVDLWAPAHIYGRPDDLRAFVDAAHSLGLAVILDVVYNHFGPDGCYLRQFTPRYFTQRYENDWGESVNFDGPDCAGVREFVAENAAYWIDEFHFDGLRLDATQSLNDASEEHIAATIVKSARAAAGERRILVVGENEPQDVKMLTVNGLDAMWNDDWHHSAVVAVTGRNEAYYTDYLGRPQELVSMARHGFLYQGQRYRWQKGRRGTPSIGIDPRCFICFIENHDQVANSGRGERLHRLTSPGRHRALTALLLLGPNTPMLFQGQEFGSSKPFLYFADHKPELAAAVEKGRREFLAQFPSLATDDAQRQLAPQDRATFEQCILDFNERETNAHVVELHRDLIRLRRNDPAFAAQRRDRIEGAVLGEEAFCLRFFEGEDRLLIVNLGRDLHLDPAPEPLLAPPAGKEWRLLWSSEGPKYGGHGTAPLESAENWRIPGHAAVVLAPTTPPPSTSAADAPDR